jgi:hypothetical protein
MILFISPFFYSFISLTSARAPVCLDPHYNIYVMTRLYFYLVFCFDIRPVKHCSDQ